MATSTTLPLSESFVALRIFVCTARQACADGDVERQVAAARRLPRRVRAGAREWGLVDQDGFLTPSGLDFDGHPALATRFEAACARTEEES